MSQHKTIEGCLSEMKMLERVKYFPRQLLTVAEMKDEQKYFQKKLLRHNFYMHGWGTVCGLGVSAAPTAEFPWQVKIGVGYALGPYGHEIYMAEPVCLDLARCGPGTVTDPCDPGFLGTSGSATGEQLFIAIKYAECLAKPVRAMPSGCGCEEEACEYSRIRDSFQIECLTELPPSHEPPPGPLLCDLVTGKQLPACPPCPSEPWVVLAQITLPVSPTVKIENSKIDDFTFRRQVFSTAVLQEQLIKCCCKDEPTQPKPVRVINVDPPNATIFSPQADLPSGITITFDKFVRFDTLGNAFRVTMSVNGGTPEEVPVDIVVFDTGDIRIKQATFNPSEPFSRNQAGLGTVYEITARGDGSDPILDVDDLALDGNCDGLPGGDFVSRFTILSRPVP